MDALPAPEVDARRIVAGTLAAPGGVLVGLAWADSTAGTAAALLAALALGAAALAFFGRALAGRTLSLRVTTRCGAALLGVALVLVTAALSAGLDEGRSVALANLVAAPGLVLVLPGALRLSPLASRRLWLGALGLGLLLRLLLVVAEPRGITTYDSASYTLPAYALLEGRGLPLVPERTPGYSLFHAASVGVGGLLFARVLNALLLGPTCAGLLLLALRSAGVAPTVGVALAVWLVLCPDLLLMEWQVMNEALFAPITLVSALAALQAARPARGDLRWSAAAGLTLALAILVRPLAQPLLPLFLAALALRVRPWSRAAACAVVLAAVCAVPCGGWCLRNLVVHGAPRLTFLTGMTLFGAAAAELPLDRPPHLEVKRAITPDILWFRDAGPNAVHIFLYGGGTGAASRLARFAPSPRAVDDLAGALAREAILAHPLRWTARRVWHGRFFLAPCYRRNGIAPPADNVADQEDQVPAELLRAAPLQALSTRPEVREAGWSLARPILIGLDALLYPVTLLLPFLALGACCRRGAGAERFLTLAGFGLMATAVLGNMALVRYSIPSWPLFAVAVGLGAGRFVPAADPGDGRIAV